MSSTVLPPASPTFHEVSPSLESPDGENAPTDVCDQVIEDVAADEVPVAGELLTGTSLAGLMTLPGVGEKRAVALGKAFATWEDLRTSSADRLGEALGAKTARDLCTAGLPDHAPVEEMGEDTRVVSIFDPDYPTALRTIPDPPTLLWVTGTLPPEGCPTLAVVGTRTPNGYGSGVARRISTDAAAHGIPTISGLAAGCDSIAHTASLDSGVPTWAVLGQGLGTLPGTGTRADLAARILDAGGGLISEVPYRTPVAAHLLTRRNRLQTGLASAVVIAQTGLATGTKPAGTLHTARYAIAQLRPLAVAAVPGHLIGDSEMAGNAALTCPFGMDPALLHATDPQIAALIRMRVPVADLVLRHPHDMGYLFDRLLAATRTVPVTVSR